MKKLIALLLLSTPLWADGPIYKYEDSKLNNEWENVHHDIKYPQSVFVQTSSMTAIYAKISSITVTQLNVATLIATTGTINSFMVVGTATNDNAPTGRIGEYVESVVGFTDCASGGFKDITSISLTPGDWDVSLAGVVKRNGASYGEWDIGIGSGAGASGAGLTDGSNFVFDVFTAAGTTKTYTPVAIPPYRISTTGGTRYFKCLTDATVATIQIAGRLSARRVR